jgi:hypothetical protein
MCLTVRADRYILLLTDLLKHTLPEHPDHGNLVAAVRELEKIASTINSAIKQAERMNQVLFAILLVFHFSSMSPLRPHMESAFSEIVP